MGRIEKQWKKISGKKKVEKKKLKKGLAMG